MLTLGIQYLTGYVAASDVADRRRVEWPPHPARVFMALAAAYFQTGGDGAEREALEWLEAQPAPQICVSEHVQRSVVKQFVPVNDKPGPSKSSLPNSTGLTRARQPRTFARAWLEDDVAYLVWSDVEAATHFLALERLCAKVTRVGHSASLVQVWASQTLPDKPLNWLPDDGRATAYFRVTSAGSLNYLERQFNDRWVAEYLELKLASGASDQKGQQAKAALRERFRNQAPVRLWPELSISQGYAPPGVGPEAAVPGTVFDPRLLVFALRRFEGPYRSLDLSSTLQLTARFRDALLHHLGANPPEVLSGHNGPDRSERPHIAILPLPFVGHEHAHGDILGVALAAPHDLGAADRQALLRAITALRSEGLRLGPLGRWSLERPGEGAARMALQDRVWTGVPSGRRQWATVTPYVYDRHPKAKNKAAYQLELADAVRESWQRVRQSSEVSAEVVITPVSAHLGAPASHQFPRLARKDGSECRHTHAILIFSQPVVGPVLLGAGRYRGYGLCRPLEPGT